MVSLVLYRFDLVSVLLQLVDCLPHSRSGYAKFIAKLLTGHVAVCLTEHLKYFCFHRFPYLILFSFCAIGSSDSIHESLAILIRKCRFHDGLNGMHTVLCLIKDNGTRSLENFIRYFKLGQAEFLVYLLTDRRLQIMECR